MVAEGFDNNNNNYKKNTNKQNKVINYEKAGNTSQE